MQISSSGWTVDRSRTRVHASRSTLHTLAPAEHSNLVSHPARELFAGAIRPVYHNRIHAPCRPKTEMQPGFLAAQVAGAGIEPTGPAPAAGPHGNLGSVGVPLQGRVQSPEAEPVAAFGGDVLVEAG